MRTHWLSFAAVLLSAVALWAVPSFTPVIDGVKDAGWGNTPDHATTTQRLPNEFNLDGGLYVTDDGVNIYFGFDADNDPWTDNSNPHIHILIDIGSTADGGAYAPWGAGSVIYAHPFRPEYNIVTQWGDGVAPYTNAIQFTGLNRWVAGNWSQIFELTNDAGGGGSWTEIALPKTMINSPAQGTVLNLSMWLRPAWYKPGAVACLPADDDFPSNNGDVAGTFNSQFSYTLQTAAGDNDPPGVLNVRQIDRTGVEIIFDEPMNEVTLNQSSNYTFNGFTFIGFRYVTATTVGINAAPPGFGAGSNYSIVCGPGIRDVSNNSIDPADNTAAWTGVAYGDVTITAIDLSQTHDQIRFKGSFNFYHEYDPSWSGGSYSMYDDGTHGDPVSGDHQFTLIFPLVPHTPENFQWGLEDENQNWLIIGPNQEFSLPDTNDIAVSYTIPDYTDQPVTVTFQCDMQFIADPFQMVRLAGSFNGWTGADMSDGDLDGVWTLNVVIPANSPPHQEFKFQRIDGGNTIWESMSNNRAFDVDDSQPTQVLPNMFFDNYLAAPYNLTAYRVNDNVELRWNDNYRRVFFEIYGTSDPADSLIVQPGNFLGSVPAGAGNHFTDSNVPARKYYRAITTVEPVR